MNTEKITNKNIIIYFISVILLRLFTMWKYPLTDTTEARYGELARKMLEKGDWVTLWHDYGVPFWAKPPLSTWVSAFSMKIFGVNAFAARLPTLIISVILMYLFWRFLLLFLDKSMSLLAIVILSSMTLFYFVSGTVMTDMVLMFSVVLVLIAFWFAVEENSKKWGYVFFAGLGICLIAKGPVAIVLALLPIFFWLIWAQQWKKMFTSLPWIGGIVLTLLIGIPWYVLAEMKTPGFLNYFIVGEHIDRFLVPAWSGDLYGNAHPKKLGTIWVFLLADSFPWVFIVLPIFVQRLFKKIKKKSSRSYSNQDKYILCWFLVPLIFFSFAKNILMTYAITILPAFAIIISQSIASIAFEKGRLKKWVYAVALITPMLLLISIYYTERYPKPGKVSAIHVSQIFQEIREKDSHPMIYLGKRRYSMEFYNAGKVSRYDSLASFQNSVKDDKPYYLALNKAQTKALTSTQKEHLVEVSSTPLFNLYKYNIKPKF